MEHKQYNTTQPFANTNFLFNGKMVSGGKQKIKI
jgi:hypothetical protein